jgi:hypothetical protein
MLGALYCNRTATHQKSGSFIFSAASEQRESAKTYEQTQLRRALACAVGRRMSGKSQPQGVEAVERYAVWRVGEVQR